MLRQTVKVKVYVREVVAYKSFPKCWFWQRRNLIRCASDDASEQENSKFRWTNNPATYPEDMNGNVRDYPGLFSFSQRIWPPPAIIIEVFPRNESDGTRFYKFHCKRIPSNGEAAGHPWLIVLAWKNINFLLILQSFRLWISTITAFNTSLQVTHKRPLWLHSYLPSGQGVSGHRGGINGGCNSLIYWV